MIISSTRPAPLAVTSTAPSSAPANPAMHGLTRDALAADATGGAKGIVRTETLPNGVRIVIAERPGATQTKLQVGMGAGSLQDPEGKLGLAHLSEHLAFEGSPTRTATEQERARIGWGNDWNAYTDRDSVIYYGVVPTNDATAAAELISDMYINPKYATHSVKQERAAVENEMTYYDGSLGGQVDDIATRLIYGDTPATNNVIGTRGSVDAITTKDLRAFHDRYAVGRNTVVLVEGDPAKLPLDVLRKQFGALPAGSRVDNNGEKATAIPGTAIQVINEPDQGTVNLDVLIPIPADVVDGLKTPLALIKTSLGNLLNDKVRRTDHLSYGVSAKILPGDDTDAPATYLLTVQTQVAKGTEQQALKDLIQTLAGTHDGIGAKTFAKNKASALADVRAMDPADLTSSISDQGEATFQQALLAAGAEVVPGTEDDSRSQQRYDIGHATNAQFGKDAAKLIDFTNLKVMAHGNLPDGGRGLVAALKDAGVDTKGISMNPVDLDLYSGQGIPVGKDSVPTRR
ncbi:MAG: pepR [Thermoleophilia bacterium]|nr:pepR [Thermoleophilia bacterium]